MKLLVCIKQVPDMESTLQSRTPPASGTTKPIWPGA